MKSFIQALKIIKKGKIFIRDEYVQSSKSLNRITAENIYSNTNYPSANNSSFDGFTIKSSDTKNLSKKKDKLFMISGSIAAGDKLIKKNFKNLELMKL